jgi:DNA-directed RNA polymerase beta subunit
MQVSVFVGVNYYGRLKHMVADKYQFRTAEGPKNAITRQPTKTAGGGSGGLRIGEMERDALLAHGVSGFLKESFAERSDGHRMLIDADEGIQARVERPPRAHDRSVGAVAGGPPRFAGVQVPYAFKLLDQELQAMSIGMALRAEGPEGDEGDVFWEEDEEDDEEEVDARGQAGADSDEDAGSEKEGRQDADDASGDVGDGDGDRGQEE